MITAPALSAPRSKCGGGRDVGSSLGGGAGLAWQDGHAGNTGSGGGSTKPFFHPVPPSDPLRQANRLPIKVLKMLTARTGHILHPEYLQPLPSTPVSPIELDAKKSPLALLAQTCSQIGKPDPSPSSKLSSVTSNGSGGDKDSKSGPLKLSDIGVEDKSSFKPYSKPGAEKKEPGAGGCAGASSGGVSGGEKSGFRVPSATCQPFTPRTGSPTSSASACSPGLLPAEAKAGEDKKDAEGCGKGGGAGSKPAGSSPLAGASPPSVMTASLCRDPYCLSYHCASHLAGAAGASCAHDPALKSGYPLVYPTHPLHGVHSSLAGATPPSLAGHPLYPYGFMLPNDPQPHICNWVSANGPCDKRFATSEELLSHLRTHTAFPGTDKLLSSYPSSSSLASAAAAAMACHMHIPTTGAPGSPGTLALRSPHHALGLSSRYHPYSKSPLPTPGAPVPVPAATGPYYSPYALYGQRLTTASALGYQ
ncbi:PREDICTED: zinc finger protein 503 [Gavialis gangeticus]|uniref:zinc finger protein 503 n=1 Tax=Gavialis gangeticus TaxID=94835 RepID=UPI00092F3166|nr:PREDICTED: zinc finger protein 503 [Gavialis gangeticus]